MVERLSVRTGDPEMHLSCHRHSQGIYCYSWIFNRALLAYAYTSALEIPHSLAPTLSFP
jgi:hypothetical protein